MYEVKEDLEKSTAIIETQERIRKERGRLEGQIHKTVGTKMQYDTSNTYPDEFGEVQDIVDEVFGHQPINNAQLPQALELTLEILEDFTSNKEEIEEAKLIIYLSPNRIRSDYDDQGNGAIEDNEIMKKAKKFNTKVKNVLNEIEIKVPILIEDNESLKARCNSWKEKVKRFKVNKEKYKIDTSAYDYKRFTDISHSNETYNYRYDRNRFEVEREINEGLTPDNDISLKNKESTCERYSVDEPKRMIKNDISKMEKNLYLNGLNEFQQPADMNHNLDHGYNNGIRIKYDKTKAFLNKLVCRISSYTFDPGRLRLFVERTN
ncbi:17355_t:CDS:2 [Dentiscutata erythropus]|uniref:17355_t:CDS:1 n=1 Tax=Dentiscutata erythropus TaxID=1348616 RepID=A0A9N8VU06_9GLOM|nr:17355_t:CDS:2 [Dentiscutata erythropus]